MRSGAKGVESKGFTLIEVMFALAILFGGLTILLQGAASSVASTKRAQLMTVAAELGRMKMYDIEETLLHDGFQEIDKEEEGDFSDEDWKQIKWSSKITKIDISNPQALVSMVAGIPFGAPSEGEGGEESAGLFDDFNGGGGGGIFETMLPIVSNILEKAIRKVHLKVMWKNGKEDQEINLDCYFVDPTAIRL